MEGKKMFEKMKEELVQLFSEYIKNMNETELYHFFSVLDSDNVLSNLAEECKKIQCPESVLTCEKCEKIYGSCDSEMKNSFEETRVCIARFKTYCNSDVDE